jgi:hypothetical protein
LAPPTSDTAAQTGSGGSTNSNSGTHRKGQAPQNPSAKPGANTEGNHQNAEQAAKNADGSGANDTLLLTVLVLGFTAAVGGVVIAAGRRGGRRVH